VKLSIQKRRFLVVGLPLILLVAAYLFVFLRSRREHFPFDLLQNAYFEQRPLVLRIGSASHSPLRMQRGQRVYHADRPLSLIEAEAVISRGLRNNAEDSQLLIARGQANLLEWSYEAAITDMQEALDVQPNSSFVLNALATAYFERAEAESRFEDYGTAFELQSRALQRSPGDPIVLFNRAVTASRLFLYKQSMEDFQRYLAMDSSGGWSDEVRQRLEEVQEIIETHERRTKVPPLTAAEFVRTVNPSDPQTWGAVEPRIEEYLSAAITEWLPAAYPLDQRSAATGHERQALTLLALILQTRHSDSWLSDLLSTTGSGQFAQAVDALRNAINANNADYVLGRKEAERAAQLFSVARNNAGEIRSRFETIYATRLSDAGPECLHRLRDLSPLIDRSRYRRLQIQARLERYNCLSEVGNLTGTGELMEAYRTAQLSGYKAIELRLLGTLAFDDLFKGRQRAGLGHCRDGLRQYWAGWSSTYIARLFYWNMGYAAERVDLWHLARSADDQDVSVASNGKDPISLAIEHMNLARASVSASEPQAAQTHLKIAENLLSSAPQTGVTDNYRLTAESYSALIDGQLGRPEDGLARLERVRARLDKIANTNVVADFYRISGELQLLAGHLTFAEAEITKAVALGEKMRRSLRSESDQVSWGREWSKPYLDLVEIKLQEGNPSDALAVWELYRRAKPLIFERSNPPASTGDESGAAVSSLNSVLSQESELIRNVSSGLGDGKLLIMGMVPHGMVLWTYGERGITAKWLQEEPANLRLQIQRISELCAQPSSSLGDIRSIAKGLYRNLLEPFSDQLQPNQILIIQADEALAAVPFQALVDASGKYLEDQHPVVYLPTLVDRLAPSGNKIIDSKTRALVVADGDTSVEGLRPLSDVLTEARVIARYLPNGQLLTDAQASLSAVRSQLSKAEVFHFAGHTLARGTENGLLLKMKDGEDRVALLDAKTVSEIEMPLLRLVVLSACSTENGGAGRSGDVDSLAKAFLNKGVRHVLATRWNIDSGSTVFLMEIFYRDVLLGSSVPRALANAEAALRTREPHPYYWAAFDVFQD
jgi:CHAT domain-containing protein